MTAALYEKGNDLTRFEEMLHAAAGRPAWSAGDAPRFTHWELRQAVERCERRMVGLRTWRGALLVYVALDLFIHGLGWLMGGTA